MNKAPRTQPPKAKTMAQAQADFTSEGAPPPGKVGTERPATSRKIAPASLRAAPNLPGTRKGPKQGRYG